MKRKEEINKVWVNKYTALAATNDLSQEKTEIKIYDTLLLINLDKEVFRGDMPGIMKIF